jgi:hypothetical protein
MNRRFKDKGGGRLDIVQLHVIAQAIEDVLRYELGLPLEGALSDEATQIYHEALDFLRQYPKFKNRYKKINKLNWLREVECARE